MAYVLSHVSLLTVMLTLSSVVGAIVIITVVEHYFSKIHLYTIC